MSLYIRLKESLKKDIFSNEQEAELVKAIDEGYAFFSQFNRSRMELAFSIFSEEMKKALFEVIFFLHVNDSKFEEHTFLCTEIQKVHGVKKEVEVEEIASLYVQGAPTGVVGISEVSAIFKDEFNSFAQSELGTAIHENKNSFQPVYSIASLGSIGTVGHKQTASDLDLQVQYELEPFLHDKNSMTDSYLKDRSNALINHFSRKFQLIKKIKPRDMKDASIRNKILSVGHKNFSNRFPMLYQYLITKKTNVPKLLSGDKKQKIALLNEITGLQKLHSSLCMQKARSEKEALLKEKIRKIQKYVQRKYPKAEVYLFAYSNDDYRDGKHGTTLESKEASGSAYELILNYEVLMPGIQFTPMIPIHFLMPGSVNSNRPLYESLVEKIRFGFTDIYNSHRGKLVDLGSTPPLTTDYMVSHSGAIYWESFKASSGNLPKAMLNLLRFEMLFDERFNTSIIELIKNPKRLDKFAGEAIIPVDEIQEEYSDYDFDDPDTEIIDDYYDDFGIEAVSDDGDQYVDDTLGEEDNPEGMSIDQLFKMEERFPSLRQDPWWLRYKALKIGFGPDNKVIQDEDEKLLISRVIDMGFALHIRVSDIFVNIREARKPETYREKFLATFLEKAFTGVKRRQLEHIANGEVESVIKFENDLKYLFQRSMDRVQEYVDKYGGEDKTNQDENKIWFHYYQKNFDPPKNVIRRDILSHLKVPRGRLQIGINKKQRWFFKSIQKSSLGGGKDGFGHLQHLPDEVELFEHESFMHGIAHCILNGYYGVLNRGTLKESRTVLEYSVGHTEVGKRSADKYAFIRPDIVDRLVDSIDKAFPPQDYDFRDCIFKEKEVTDVFICLNLLEYGRVSFIYRDNLKNWCVDEFDHRPVEKAAEELYQKQELILHSRHIQNTIKDFFSKHAIDFDKITKEGGLAFWVNPNSVNTYHAADKFAQKELYLASTFKEAVYRSNSAEFAYKSENSEEVEEAIVE